MQGEKFTLMQYNVNAILGFIEAGQFVIPEIQRPFVWKRAQVRDLIDSLYNGYPTGYIITWKNPDVKTKDGTVANGKHVLIDGQQRITALMASIAGLEVLDEDFNRDRVKIAFNPLATDSDKRFAVQDASHLKDKKWIPDISEVFKNDFDPFEFVPKYCNNNLGVKPNEVNNAIMKLRGIANRQIGVIELDPGAFDRIGIALAILAVSRKARPQRAKGQFLRVHLMAGVAIAADEGIRLVGELQAGT